MAYFNNQNPYQINQSQPKVAAATNVAKPGAPSSFLNNIGSFVGNAVNSVGKFLVSPAPAIPGLPDPTKLPGSSFFNPPNPTTANFTPGSDKARIAPQGNPNIDVMAPKTQNDPSKQYANLLSQGGTINPDGTVTPKVKTIGDVVDNTTTPTALTPLQTLDANNPNSANGNSPNINSQNNVISSMANNPTLLQQLVDRLKSIGGGNNNPAVQTATQNLQDFQTKKAQNEYDVDTRGGDLAFATGAKGAIENKYAAELPAYQTAVQNALTGQGQQIGATTSAIGAAAPIQVPYSNQIINPLTGQPIIGTGNTTLDTAVQNALKMIQNGSTYSDATATLSGYGQGGINALQKALPPGFNITKSNTSSGTQQTGQNIQTSANAATTSIATLQGLYDKLPGLLGKSNPTLNSITNGIESFFGSADLSSYKAALDDVRSQFLGVLNSSGGTPTNNEATVKQYLPDNMTPAQFKQNIATVQSLIQSKVQAFTSSGNNQGGSSPTTGFNW